MRFLAGSPSIEKRTAPRPGRQTRRKSDQQRPIVYRRTCLLGPSRSCRRQRDEIDSRLGCSGKKPHRIATAPAWAKHEAVAAQIIESGRRKIEREVCQYL